MSAADWKSHEVSDAAERALSYLSATDPRPDAPCDAIIGFGVFDLGLPRFCGELYTRGIAPFIIFTGGLGAGTGSLGGPEADAWREALRASHPDIPEEHILTENRSTNTAENIAFTAELLRETRPSIAFGAGIRTAVIVASPSRLRRVRLAMCKLQPAVRVIRQLPPVDFDAEHALYARNGVDYLAHLTGELDRLVAYPKRGWIAPEPLPPEIAAAHAALRGFMLSREPVDPAP